MATPGPEATSNSTIRDQKWLWYGTAFPIVVPIVKDTNLLTKAPGGRQAIRQEARERSMDRLTIQKIAKRSISLGASRVGVIPVAPLRDSPSHRRYPVDLQPFAAFTVVVLALEHPAGQPEMDWWDNWQGGTPGNRRLINLNRRLVKWLHKKYAAEAYNRKFFPCFAQFPFKKNTK